MTTKTVPIYSKLKMYDAFLAMGRTAEFKGFLAMCPEAVQDRWELATELESDDPDMVAMVIALQTAWQWSDAERDALLASVTVRTVQKIDRVAAQAELDALLNMPVPDDAEVLELAKQGQIHEYYSRDRLIHIAYLQGELA